MTNEYTCISQNSTTCQSALPQQVECGLSQVRSFCTYHAMCLCAQRGEIMPKTGANMLAHLPPLTCKCANKREQKPQVCIVKDSCMLVSGHVHYSVLHTV